MLQSLAAGVAAFADRSRECRDRMGRVLADRKCRLGGRQGVTDPVRRPPPPASIAAVSNTVASRLPLSTQRSAHLEILVP